VEEVSTVVEAGTVVERHGGGGRHANFGWLDVNLFGLSGF
jgi:hypothetical protein